LLVLGGLAVAQGLTAPTLPTLVSLASAGDEQGVILGLRQSCGAAARALGPLVAGFLYDFKSASPYWLGGILALGASLLTMRMGLRVPEGKEAIDE
jgi:MFS family permease